MEDMAKAEALMREGQWEKAFQAFAQWQHPEALLYQTICLTRLQKTQDALLCINRALDLQPQEADFLSERGVVYLHMKKYALALLDFDAAVNLQPDRPYRYASRAFMKEAAGDLQGAVKDYEKALVLDPEDAVVQNNLGLLLEKLGRNQEARSNFSKADALLKSFPMPAPPPEVEMPTEKELQEKTMGQILKETIATRQGRAEFFRWMMRSFSKK
jgi:tetratricopeptide (TPR) repeat protein